MCVGIFMKFIDVDGIVGKVSDGQWLEIVDFLLMFDVIVGDWVFMFFGVFRDVISVDEVEKIFVVLVGLCVVMVGGIVGNVFVDFDVVEL